MDFSVRIAVDRRDSARVTGLGDPRRLSLLRVRSTRALEGESVLVEGDPAHRTRARRICSVLRNRGIEAHLASAGAGGHSPAPVVVEPRRASQLLARPTLWINLGTERAAVEGIDRLRHVPAERYGEQLATVLARIAEQQDGVEGLVLLDESGESRSRVARLNTRRIAAPVYYVAGGHAAWQQWRTFNRRLVRARSTVGRSPCAR